MTAELINDTLYMNEGSILVVGQKMLLGEPTGQKGYRSILSNYAGIVPEIWGPNQGYENQFENYIDSKKGRAAMNKLKPGDIFSVTKIFLYKAGKASQCYLVQLSLGEDIYKCDITLALSLGELSIH